MSDRELEEDRAAELGYRTAGARELSLRDWLSMQGERDEAAPNPRAFKALCDRLRVVKWQRDNPERTAAKAKRYYLRGGKDRQLETARARRLRKYRASNPIIVCRYCRVKFCLVRPHKGIRTQLCSVSCEQGEQQAKRRRRMGSKQHACSRCGGLGHNRLTCNTGAPL